MPIFHTTYAFIIALSTWHRQCPKPHRHGTAQYCYTLGLDILKLLLRAIAEPTKRLYCLREMSMSVDQLKIFLRLAKDTGALTPKNYINLQASLQEIGKQLGGWLRDLQTKRPATGVGAFCEK